MTAITERLSALNVSWTVRTGRYNACCDRARGGEAMSLGAMAIAGLGVAVVLIVIAITLINKFAD